MRCRPRDNKGRRVHRRVMGSKLSANLETTCPFSAIDELKGVAMSHCFKDGVRSSSYDRRICLSFAVMLLWVLTARGYAQVDPGIRGGPPGAGPAFGTGLTAG